MIREHIMKNEDRDLMRKHAAVMGDNEFFHQFLSKYQKGLSRALQKTKEKSEAESNSAALKQPKSKMIDGKGAKKTNFGKQIMDHVTNTNYYRKNLPALF